MFAKSLLSVLAAVVAVDAHYVHVVPAPAHYAPQPYKFGYNINDKYGQQHRQETGDGYGGVSGSYGFTDHRGIQREVSYVADRAGFRAQVKTNEPGTANQDPAAVKIVSSAQPAAYHPAPYRAPAPALHIPAPAPYVHHAPAPAPYVHHAPAPAPYVHHGPAPVPYAHHVPAVSYGTVTKYDSRYGHY